MNPVIRNIRQLYLKKELSSVFLLPLFFILHGYNDNFALIPLPVVLNLFVRYLLITGAIIFISVLLLRKSTHAVVFAFFLLVLFFFFGAFHDLIKKIFGLHLLTSYTFLLPFLLVVFVWIFFICKRMARPPLKMMYYMICLLSVLIFLEVVKLSYNLIQGRSKQNDLTRGYNLWQRQGGLSQYSKPDIFFVVLDGYTSSQCLKEEFDFDNHEVDSLFAANHFFVSQASKSNYNATPFSLSTTLDGNYLAPELGKTPVSSKIFLQAMETFKNNRLVQFLEQEGYAIKNYGCFDLKGAPAPVIPYFDDLYARQIDEQTLYSRIMRDIGWNFQLKNIFTGSFRVPESYRENKAMHLYRNRYNWNALMQEMQTKAPKPRFVYAHIMMPHEPYFLNADGREVSDTDILLNRIDPKQGYLGQVKYCNKLLQQLIPLVNKNSGGEKVVIIEGDHGFREYSSKLDRNKEFMNLNGCFFSDTSYHGFYNGVSPVNTFRIVFNKYFQYNLPLLKDSSFSVHQ
jgi:hypothetical protein